MLVNHAFIPGKEIVVKIGDDHAGKSFKMSYQIAKINHPKRDSNTVIFSIFDGKDNLPNLRMCLDRYPAHITKLMNVTWKGKVFRSFMFGDYAFLCSMYGLSGASAVHPCLWCLCLETMHSCAVCMDCLVLVLSIHVYSAYVWRLCIFVQYVWIVWCQCCPSMFIVLMFGDCIFVQYVWIVWCQCCLSMFIVLMFGDYAFLCSMYGLSGASAVHPCLWCLCLETMHSCAVCMDCLVLVLSIHVYSAYVWRLCIFVQYVWIVWCQCCPSMFIVLMFGDCIFVQYVWIVWCQCCLSMFIVLMFGDYAFLCSMYGLSGASAVHPCLQCLCLETMHSCAVCMDCLVLVLSIHVYSAYVWKLCILVQYVWIVWCQCCLSMFIVLMFGDYAFLCSMYGLSGASAVHPCLQCLCLETMHSCAVCMDCLVLVLSIHVYSAYVWRLCIFVQYVWIVWCQCCPSMFIVLMFGDCIFVQYVWIVWCQCCLSMFIVLMFGDYAFLCSMYGLSGASAVYPCLWCLCSKNEMQVAKCLRPSIRKSNTTKLEGKKKGLAKTVFNVIDEPFFSITIGSSLYTWTACNTWCLPQNV